MRLVGKPNFDDQSIFRVKFCCLQQDERHFVKVTLRNQTSLRLCKFFIQHLREYFGHFEVGSNRLTFSSYFCRSKTAFSD